ncbi:unnamed protein product, partial [Rotaria magnacalcarata]
AQFISPQYAFVNKTIQINIPVSDVNAGDDVRCRWSTYTTGYRRRKRSDKEDSIIHPSGVHFYNRLTSDQAWIHIRERRSCGGGCGSSCSYACSCACSGCSGTGCSGISGICDGSNNCVA